VRADLKRAGKEREQKFTSPRSFSSSSSHDHRAGWIGTADEAEPREFAHIVALTRNMRVAVSERAPLSRLMTAGRRCDAFCYAGHTTGGRQLSCFAACRRFFSVNGPLHAGISPLFLSVLFYIDIPYKT
jgi:hypothetical protein